MSEWSGSDQKYFDLFSIINKAYSQIFPKKNIQKQLYFK